jgi:hypothetical protein
MWCFHRWVKKINWIIVMKAIKFLFFSSEVNLNYFYKNRYAVKNLPSFHFLIFIYPRATCLWYYLDRLGNTQHAIEVTSRIAHICLALIEPMQKSSTQIYNLVKYVGVLHERNNYACYGVTNNIFFSSSNICCWQQKNILLEININ